jgi:hypothetical protein
VFKIFDLNILPQKEERVLGVTSAKNAFDRQYKDPHGARLNAFTTLQEYERDWRPGDYYFPGVAIIQSSGLGKSKMLTSMHELGVHVVYCSFMKNKQNGYPKRTLFADYFTSKADEIEMRFTCFYLACNELVKEAIDKKEGATSFYLRQINEPDVFAKHLEHRMDILMKNRDFSSLKFSEVFSAVDQLRLLVVFDEVRDLLPKEDELKQSSAFAAMRRAATKIPQRSGFFIAMLDTVSRVSNLSPVNSKDYSQKVVIGGLMLFPPIYLISTMDIEVKDRPTTLKDVLSPRYQYCFGRPLWGSLLEVESSAEEVLRLACSKILGGGISLTSNFNYKSLTTHLCLSLLRARIPFSVCRESLSSELVAGFMWTCLFVSPDRHSVVSSMASEPVVSEAACHWMSLPGVWKEVLQQYVSMLTYGSVSAGLNGEAAIAIMCVLARDRVVLQKARLGVTMNEVVNDNDSQPENKLMNASADGLPQEHAGALQQHNTIVKAPLADQKKYLEMPNYLNAPISVSDFFYSMVHSEIAAKVRDYCSGMSTSTKRRNPFIKGTINFTHVVHLNYTPKKSDLLNCFCRSAAIDCKTGQAGSDFIIPVLLGTELTEDNMTYILIQSKNYASGGKDKDYSTSAGTHLSAHFVGIEDVPRELYISMYIGLGGRMKWAEFPEFSNPKDPDFNIPESIINYDPTTIEEVENQIAVLRKRAFGEERNKEALTSLNKLLEKFRETTQISVSLLGFDDEIYPCISGKPFTPGEFESELSQSVNRADNPNKEYVTASADSLYESFHLLVRHVSNPTGLQKSAFHKQLVMNLCSPTFANSEPVFAMEEGESAAEAMSRIEKLKPLKTTFVPSQQTRDGLQQVIRDSKLINSDFVVHLLEFQSFPKGGGEKRRKLENSEYL